MTNAVRVVTLTKGFVAVVDESDYEDVMAAGPWHFSSGYAARYLRGSYAATGKSQAEQMHNFLLGRPPVGLQIDHINRDRLDNRRSNLRVVTASQNQANRWPPSTKQFKGVRRTPQGWRASLCGSGLGVFTTAEAAAAVWNAAARARWGDAVLLNPIPIEVPIDRVLPGRPYVPDDAGCEQCVAYGRMCLRCTNRMRQRQHRARLKVA